MEELTETDFMINPFVINIVKNLAKVSSTLGFLPFYWDTSLGKFRINNWSWARTLQNWLWLAFYGVLVLPTHVIELHMASKDLHTLRSNKTIIYLLTAMTLCWVFTMFLGASTFKPLVMCQFLNGFLKYVETFPAKYIATWNPSKEMKKWKIFEFLAGGVTVFFFATALPEIAHCYIFPTAPAYPAFRVPSYALSLPVHLLSSTWFSVSGLNFVSVSLIFTIYGFYFFMAIGPILADELRLGRASYKTTDILREPFHLVVNYRALQILLKTFNVEIGIIFVPVQICVTQAILICNVSLAFQWELFRVNTKIFLGALITLLFVGWSIFLWLAGMLYMAAEDTVKSWKLENWAKRRDRMYVQRVKPTCQPITFGDGKRFVIRPTKVLQFFDSVSTNTFRAFATYAKVFGY